MTLDFLPKIDVPKCTGCELCIKMCPNNVLSLINNRPVIANSDICDYTAACQDICPTGAISLVFEIVLLEKPGKSRML